MRGTLAITTVFGLTALAGCGSDPANIAGDYTVTATNQDQGCTADENFVLWDPNGVYTNIAVTITQNGETASAEITGAWGNLADGILGSHTFVGPVDGDSFELLLTGDINRQKGNCDYHFNAVLDGSISGDTIEGELRYEAVTDSASDCTGITGCANVQTFSGTR